MIELKPVAGPLSMQFAGTVHARKSDFGNLFSAIKDPMPRLILQSTSSSSSPSLEQEPQDD